MLTLILLLWAGMILGISGLEAWVKFKAPSLTKPVGLDVGRTVFGAFHKVQWGLLVMLLVAMLVIRPDIRYFIIPAALGILLGLQTFWVFPHLNRAVEAIMSTGVAPKSPHHRLYALLEMAKLLVLIGGGLYYLKMASRIAM